MHEIGKERKNIGSGATQFHRSACQQTKFSAFSLKKSDGETRWAACTTGYIAKTTWDPGGVPQKWMIVALLRAYPRRDAQGKYSPHVLRRFFRCAAVIGCTHSCPSKLKKHQRVVVLRGVQYLGSARILCHAFASDQHLHRPSGLSFD